MENGDTDAKNLPYMRFIILAAVVISISRITARQPSFSTLYSSICYFLTSKYYFKNQHTLKNLKFVENTLTS